MPIYRGRDGVVKMGAPAEAVSRVQDWTLDESIEFDETYSMGDTSKEKWPGFKDWSGSLSTYFDPDSIMATVAVGDKLALELYPGGEAAGNHYWSGEVLIESISFTGSKDGTVGASINFQGSGDLTGGEAV